MKNPESKKNYKLKNIIKIISILTVIVLAVIVVNGYGIYKLNWQNKTLMSLAQYIPYPAAIVGNQIIKIEDLNNNYRIIKYFQDNQLLQTDEEKVTDNQIKAEVFNKLILNKIVEQLSKDYGVTVTNDEIKNEMDNIKNQLAENDNLENRLSILYGISEEYFIKKLLVPEILTYKLHQRYLEDDEIDPESKQNNLEKKFVAQNILTRIKEGEDFAKIAQEESDDEVSRTYGGDLGLFGKGEMVPEFEQAAFNLQVGEVSDVIKTTYGYHIIKVTDKKTDSKGNEQVQASHILIATTDNYSNWLKNFIKNLKVYILAPGFYWHEGEVLAS